MKRVILLILCGFMLLGCNKTESEPEERIYSFTGHVYERYKAYSFMPNRRTYFTLDFLSDTTVLRYNGTDTLGMDSVWYRKDTVMVSQLKPYQYRVTDVSRYYPYPWDCVAYIDFYRYHMYTYHDEEFEDVKVYFTYHVSDDENWLWNSNDASDEYYRIK